MPNPSNAPAEVLRQRLQDTEAEAAKLKLELAKLKEDSATHIDMRKQLEEMRQELRALLDGQAKIQTSVLEVSDGVNSMLTPPEKKEEKAREVDKEKDPALNAESGHQKAAMEEDRGLRENQLRALNGKKDALKSMFIKAESHEAVVEEKRENLRKSSTLNVATMHTETLEMYVDTIMGCVIMFNTIFIGISIDYADGHPGWMVVNVLLSLIFVAELVLKIRMHGWSHFRSPSNRISNTLDACVIFVDVLQILLEVAFPDASDAIADAPSASLFRICRLFKLVRLLRFIHSEILKDLMAMITGIIGGLTTLLWAMVLFIVVLYVIALMFREFLGRKPSQHVYDSFSSVPRSLFTSFRCSFGDCSNGSGVPIFEHVTLEYGPFYGVFYSVWLFCVVIGLFNVISAIFVESTLQAAQALEQQKLRERLQDNDLLSSRVTRFVRRIFEEADIEVPDSFVDNIDQVFETEVSCEIVDRAVADAEAIAALDDLDIHPSDRTRLSDIFDPDNGGTVGIIDIATGIRRLRGEPRRSDIICVDMMVRSLQGSVAEVKELLIDNFKRQKGE